MENATKALLIAAAVLVAIIIISLGVAIVSSAKGQVDQASTALSGAEIDAFNSKFDNYEGDSVSGTRVNALINAVFSHNLKETDDSRKVQITGSINMTTGASSKAKAETGSRYTVKCLTPDKSGLIKTIEINKNQVQGN